MSLLDFLKRKKEVEKSKKSEKKIEKALPEKKAEKKVEKSETAKKPSVLKSKNVKGFSYEAVNQPHISEKATYLAEKNQYIFKVSPNFNKNEVKNAVQGLYGVDVLSVNVVKIPAKKRRIGRTEGFRKGYKKAIVKIKDDQKIEIL